MKSIHWLLVCVICFGGVACKKSSAAENDKDGSEEEAPKKKKPKKKTAPDLPEKFEESLVDEAMAWKGKPIAVTEFSGGLRVPAGGVTAHQKFGTMTMYTWKYEDHGRDEVLVAFLVQAKQDGWSVVGYKKLDGGARTFSVTKDDVTIGVIAGAPKGQEDKICNLLLTPPK